MIDTPSHMLILQLNAVQQKYKANHTQDPKSPCSHIKKLKKKVKSIFIMYFI